MQKQKEFLSKLLKYIDIANEVKVYLPTRREIIEISYKSRKRQRILNDLEIIENYKPHLDRFPTVIQEKVSALENLSLSKTQLNQIYKSILNELEEISSAVNTLARIAWCVTEEYLVESEKRGHYCVNAIIDDLESVFPETLSNLSIGVTINKEGFLTTKTSEFFDFISRNNIEGKRIRLCLVCEKIFWADRIDKWSCGKTCGNTLRQRNWQQQNKSEYNEKRRKNYAYKISLKNNKEKNNGTL